VRPLDDLPVAEAYRDWAETECDDSPAYVEWALGVAEDPRVCDLVASLPAGKRQPNLVFAAARWHGADTGSYDGLRRVLVEHWADVRLTVTARATQTNEVGRCAALLPVLASLPGPLALLEVGCSAGLCLFPDRYSYRYTGAAGEVSLDPVDGPSPVVLDCVVEGDAPLPSVLPEVVWRGGIDLNPLDVRDEDAMRWLRTLVWPEHEGRRARLAAAVDLVREEPPAQLVRGDLLDDTALLADEVPGDATLVIFHSAVLAYLEQGDRVRFVESMAGMAGHWLSNEGPRVVLPVGATAGTPPASPVLGTSPFALGLDGRAVAWTHGHGGSVSWI
jgi:hypothetical protein